MKEQEMITRDNYEEYLFLEIDGELDDTGREALTLFLAAAPDIAQELNDLRSLKLVPDDAVIFEEKSALLKASGEHRKIISLPARWWMAGAAAAAVAGLVWISIPRSDVGINNSANTPAFASNGTQTTRTTPVAIPATTPVPVALNTILTNPRTTDKKKEGIRVASQHENLLSKDTDNMATLSANPTQLPVQASEIKVTTTTIAIAEMPEPATDAEHLAPHKGIHFAFAQLPALQNLKNAAGETVARISNSSYNLKDVALSMKLGNRSFSISF